MLRLIKRNTKRKQCRNCYRTFWNTKDVKVPTTLDGKILFSLGFENRSDGKPIKTKTFKACPYCDSTDFIEV